MLPTSPFKRANSAFATFMVQWHEGGRLPHHAPEDGLLLGRLTALDL